MKVKIKVKSLSRVRLPVTLWTSAHQAPLSMGFSRQEDWSGMPLPSPEVLYFWQIWNHRISELTMSHDYVIMNLQGDCPQYLGDISLCEEWPGVSVQISENENHVINAINLENQDITA